MRTLSLLQAAPGQSRAFQAWLLGEFAPERRKAEGLIVNLAVPEPPGLSLYDSREAAAGERFDAVVEATLDGAQGFAAWMHELQRLCPVRLVVHHGYAVTVTTVLHREGFTPGCPTPGYKLLRGVHLHDDLPDAAAQRMWAHHSSLALRVHVGMARYARLWVDARLTPSAPAVRAFSDLPFPGRAKSARPLLRFRPGSGGDPPRYRPLHLGWTSTRVLPGACVLTWPSIAWPFAAFSVRTTLRMKSLTISGASA